MGLVAVTILVALTLSIVGFTYLMGGLAGNYANVENIKISSINATKDSNYYILTFLLKNSGSVDATISYIAINGKPLNSFASDEVFTDLSLGEFRVPSGQNVTLKLSVKVTLYVSDSDLNINFHSTSGKDYLQTLSLP